MRRTKILATLGPATRGRQAIAELVSAGANAFRLNFSHGQSADHEAAVADIRAVEAELEQPLCILGDLPGPKIRCGELQPPGTVALSAGQTFRLTADASPGNAQRVGVTLGEVLVESPVGTHLLLRDGLIELVVEAVETDALVCRVLNAGQLTSGAGINLPSVDLSVPALTARDRDRLQLAARLELDWVALSFVRRPSDLKQAREAMAELGCQAKLMAKIEKPSAVELFDELLAEADGVMIARGDLGVELPPEQVPVVQRRLVRRCLDEAKPVVVATQMLESMIVNPRPTRAEASDVATAIYELADAIMLSGETAVGHYPAAAVATMARVAATVEASDDFRAELYRFDDLDEPEVAAAISHSACRLAQILPAPVVVCLTMSGSTARQAARHRPAARIVALTTQQRTARALALGWGQHPLVVETHQDLEALVAAARERLLAAQLVEPGDPLVITAGVPIGVSGRTNLLRVERA